MKLTKTQAALEAAQKGKATVLKKLAAEKEEGVRVAALVGTSAAIGNLEVSGRMRDVPQLGPLPRTATLAFLAKAGAMFVGNGTAKNVLNGIGDASICIASYNFTRGAEISGVSNTGMFAREREAAEEMERNLERRHRRGNDLEGALLDGDD
jgi:hypothetical protein